MKNKFALLRSRGAQMTAAVTAFAVSSANVFADAAVDTAITAAQEAGKTSVQLTGTGLIQIVAVIVGIGLIIGLLKKV